MPPKLISGLSSYFALLRVEIASFHPSLARSSSLWLSRRPRFRSVSGSRFPMILSEHRDYPFRIKLRKVGITHYAVLRSPDFPVRRFRRTSRLLPTPLSKTVFSKMILHCLGGQFIRPGVSLPRDVDDTKMLEGIDQALYPDK